MASEGETEDWVKEGPAGYSRLYWPLVSQGGAAGGYSGLDWPFMGQRGYSGLDWLLLGQGGILGWTGRSWVREGQQGVFWTGSLLNMPELGVGEAPADGAQNPNSMYKPECQLFRWATPCLG